MLAEDNLLARLDSMKIKCNRLCPKFYEQLQNKRSNKFLESVIIPTRKGTDVIVFYYQKVRESIHFVEKNKTTLKKIQNQNKTVLKSVRYKRFPKI